MAERGPRPAFNPPTGGNSPVPAEYGSLGGGPAREQVDLPDRIPRKPFHWKGWRDPDDDPDGPDSKGEVPQGAAPVLATRARIGEARPVPRVRSRPVISDDEVVDRRTRRTVVPAVPRQRVGADGRVLQPTARSRVPPEARPAAYLKETIRSQQVIRHLGVWTVLRVSFLFYLLALIVVLLAGALLWNVAAAVGTIDSIDKSVRTLLDLKNFTLRPAPVLAYSTAFGVVLVVLATLVNVLAAVVFNLISDVTGGVRILVVAQPDYD